ncbi:MAG TPA: hypothetical protein VNA12_03970 [Mycobacteriales bacterium]|nr:hypothetical protein [Mycobacteriales bacterium]
MAKALLGFVGPTGDMRATAEIRRLQLRVKELEAEVADLRATHELEHSLALTASQPEPAYS